MSGTSDCADESEMPEDRESESTGNTVTSRKEESASNTNDSTSGKKKKSKHSKKPKNPRKQNGMSVSDFRLFFSKQKDITQNGISI
jgi:hypothetical protein